MDFELLASGHLAKMKTDHAQPVRYTLPLGDNRIELSPLMGKTIRIEYSGAIHCQHCGRKTKKSFSQGYCYPCFKALAQCDSCMMSPEKCHYDAGTCRQPEWGEEFCMTDHIVYLANSSGIKVGITRMSQVPTRWMDQGAIQALPIFRVATRQQSGFVEDLLREQVADKTNWRKMLKGDVEYLDLAAIRDEVLDNAWNDIVALQKRFGLAAIQAIDDGDVYEFDYPVDEFPTKVTTHNLDKTSTVEGTLKGIKGQYLILDTGVINIRKFGAYHVDFYAQTTV
ncbi:DUF2797 domain-containing protein [Pseudomaricurvus sp.]|uniref:DUF2797 domain-containing protein n=1 Tax=Pseudomaricurvus sp. TaxID=2004510 RepID=UPI003F6AB05E